MGVKICEEVVLLLLLLLFASINVSLGRSSDESHDNPEMVACKMRCDEIRDAELNPKCIQRCQQYRSQKGRRGHQHDIIVADNDGDADKAVRECYKKCLGPEDLIDHQCFVKCMIERLGDQPTPRTGGTTRRQERTRSGDYRQVEKTRRTDRQRHGSNNPYIFEDHHFTSRLENEHGNVRVLQKFTDRSEIFQGIEKYRVAFLEAEPQTFVVPNHWDADAMIFVANGEATITLIEENSRQSHNIKRGDLFQVPVGISAYLINTDSSERLVLAKILRSVSVPGDLQIFSVGDGNPESSFYNAFSKEILEAAFDIDRESVGRIIGQSKEEQGFFKKATEEQIRSLAAKDESRVWPFSGRKERGSYSIYKKDPSVANENGVLHEVDSDDFSDIRDINVAFSFFNITQGSMAGPFYNTKTTQVLMVSNGVGRFEMACPHLSEQGGRRGEINPTYEQVSSELRRGTVVVIPAGHPVVIEASGGENLEVIGFGLNSDKNEWFALAGRDNVVSQWADEAMELTFGYPASEVKRVVEKQSKKLFFKAPVSGGRAFA